jgi:hypothetical protein
MMDMSEPNTCHGRANGRTPNPLSERSRGSIMVHANKNAITRKAATGWRVNRRLNGKRERGC